MPDTRTGRSRLWACQIGSTRRMQLADAHENPFGEHADCSVRLAGRRVAFVRAGHRDFAVEVSFEAEEAVGSCGAP